jgi:hypothetical protein
VHWLVGASQTLSDETANYFAVASTLGNGGLHAAYVAEPPPVIEDDEATEERVAGNFVAPETGYTIDYAVHPVAVSPLVVPPVSTPTPTPTPMAVAAVESGPAAAAVAPELTATARVVPTLSATAVSIEPGGSISPILIYGLSIGGTAAIILVVFLAHLLKVRKN